MGDDKQGDDGEDCAMTYQKYCDDLVRFNQPITMGEGEWNRAYGKKEEAAVLIARKSDTRKNIEPTFANHDPKNPQTRILEILSNRIEAKEKSPKSKAVGTPRPKTSKKEENIAMGLTAAGKVRVLRKPGMSKEELRQSRVNGMRKRREEYKRLGLTSQGLPYKVKKAPKCIEELRADRLKYAKTWRENNREEWLTYRRELRRRSKESANNTLPSQKVS